MPEAATITFRVTEDSFQVTAEMSELGTKTFELAGNKEIVSPIASMLGTLMIACHMGLVPQVEVAA